MVFRYVKRDQREPGQKAITPIKDTMETLMTSYARPLRKIDQSIPKSGIVISTTLDSGHSRHKRFVSFKNRNMKLASSGPLKVNLRSRKTVLKATPLKVMVKQVNGMLKVKVHESNSSESTVLTDLEKTMFHGSREDHGNPKNLHWAHFQERRHSMQAVTLSC
ncbi:hypothetical protein ACLB2K_077540 [Fragaria x ananassa]